MCNSRSPGLTGDGQDSPCRPAGARTAIGVRRLVGAGAGRRSGRRPRTRIHEDRGDTVKAVVYEGPRQVSVKDVPDARIERPTDVLVRITTTNICGSDLHMYEG